jgi:hypothetical protein
MRLREIVPEDMAPMRRPHDLVLLYGAPAFMYRELALTVLRLLRAVWYRREALFYIHRLLQVSSYIAESWRLHRLEAGRSGLGPLWRFVAAYARKRARARRPGPAARSQAG